MEYKINPIKTRYNPLRDFNYNCFLILDNNVSYYNMNVVLNFMYNLLKAIHVIHSNNYAHLDIKPGNILLNINLYQLLQHEEGPHLFQKKSFYLTQTYL